jgi:riboflavin-specific deaminase-like protein
MQPARPYVVMNMAMTADGKIATANRAVSSFGSARDQQHLFELRATADAILSGARTLADEGIALGTGPAHFRRLRLKRGLAEYALRVVVSGTGSISPQAAIFQKRFSPIIVLTTQRAGARRLARLADVADEVKTCGDQEIDFSLALVWLRKKWGVNRLLAEGGGELNAALFRAGLVDELHLTLCPFVFGGQTAPTIADGSNATSLAEAAGLRLVRRRRSAEELFLVYQRLPSSHAPSSPA